MYIDLSDRLGHDLLGSVVDQDIQSTVFSNMLRYELLAVLGVHDIESEGDTFLTVLLDSLLDSLGTGCQLCIDLERGMSLLLLLLG
jgi:hypothetical protein